MNVANLRAAVFAQQAGVGPPYQAFVLMDNVADPKVFVPLKAEYTDAISAWLGRHLGKRHCCIFGFVYRLWPMETLFLG
jgi:hypothetical protein